VAASGYSEGFGVIGSNKIRDHKDNRSAAICWLSRAHIPIPIAPRQQGKLPKPTIAIIENLQLNFYICIRKILYICFICDSISQSNRTCWPNFIKWSRCCLCVCLGKRTLDAIRCCRSSIIHRTAWFISSSSTNANGCTRWNKYVSSN
jgi:hypothetical protein